MSPDKKAQYLKPLTAANKLGIHLPSAPESFRSEPLTREDLAALRSDPPEWLTELQQNGPFPKDVVARKLGVSIAGLGRAGVTEALTAQQIADLLGEQPEWLVRERKTHEQAVAEAERVETQRRERREASNRPAKRRFG